MWSFDTLAGVYGKAPYSGAAGWEKLKYDVEQTHQQLVEALASGQRIFFAPDDGNLYVERPLDRVFIDPATGNPMGATAL